MPDYISLSNVFIDDILIWDGRMYLGVLGGAGVHAVAGARVWSDSLGLIASIGNDFDESFHKTLHEMDLDLSMLQTAQEKTTRAWQIFQPDEERVEVYRDKHNLVNQISLTSLKLTEEYRNAKGYHVHFSGTPDELIANLEILKSNAPQMKIVMEPTSSEIGWGKAEFSQIFPFLDVFSPNEIEGEWITKHTKPEKMIETLIAWGANKVALRMGEKGSLIAETESDLQVIPAIKKTLVDVTGAGNAYMGGMLVGICEGEDFAQAVLWGAVSASFAIEQFGICLFNEDKINDRDARLREAKRVFESANKNGLEW